MLCLCFCVLYISLFWFIRISPCLLRIKRSGRHVAFVSEGNFAKENHQYAQEGGAVVVLPTYIWRYDQHQKSPTCFWVILIFVILRVVIPMFDYWLLAIGFCWGWCARYGTIHIMCLTATNIGKQSAFCYGLYIIKNHLLAYVSTKAMSLWTVVLLKTCNFVILFCRSVVFNTNHQCFLRKVLAHMCQTLYICTLNAISTYIQYW